MIQSRGVVEFEGTLDRNGIIAVPASVLGQFRPGKGQRLLIRLTRTAISADLEKKGVSEEEIERIALVQLESRGQVVKFLASQGSLRKHKRFMARIATSKRGATK